MFIHTPDGSFINLFQVRALTGLQTEDGKFACVASVSPVDTGILRVFETQQELGTYIQNLVSSFEFLKYSPSGIVFNVSQVKRLGVVPSESVASQSEANYKEFLACAFFDDSHSEILGTGTQLECNQIVNAIFAPKPTIIKPALIS